MHHNEDIPLPPQPFIDAIGGFFHTASDEIFRLLRDHARLHSGSRVLDLGCGCGRIASPLTTVLRDGEYDGVDIVLPMIEWCRTHISPTYTNFRFHHAALRNSHYSAEGGDAQDYRFPFPDSRYDIVLAASLFTHLAPASAAQYLREIARVLEPRGVGLLTFYIGTPETMTPEGEPRGKVPFAHRPAVGHSVVDLANPEGVIAFDEGALFAMIREAGLAIGHVSYGRWSHHPTAWSYQDVVVVGRAPPLGR